MTLRAILFVSAVLVSHVSFAETLSIRADHWMPMNGDPNEEKPGYMIEFAKEIMKEHNITIDYQLMPWGRALKMAADGKIDCVVGEYKSDQSTLIFPEENWGWDSIAFFVQKESSWQYQGSESLNGQQIGIVIGYSYGEEQDAFIKAHGEIFQPLPGDVALERNLMKLQAGRITALVDSSVVVQARLKKEGLTDKIKYAGTWGNPNALYIACSPKKTTTQQYVKWLDEGTRKLRASGRLKEILESYGLEDWK